MADNAAVGLAPGLWARWASAALQPSAAAGEKTLLPLPSRPALTGTARDPLPIYATSFINSEVRPVTRSAGR